MKKFSALSLVAVMGLALPAFAQNADKPAAPAVKPAAPTAKPTAADQPDASAEAWMKASQPGDNHKLLNNMVGTWTAKCKFWMGGPEAPATESSGTMVNRWVLDNRFVRMEFTGEFMNSPFQGLGYFGFDNVDQKFVGSWMDTMSTNMMTSTGTYDAAKKTFTMTGKFKDPQSGQMVTSRDVTTVTDNNSHKMEMYHTGADGKEHKMGEIVYTRAGAGATAPTLSAPIKDATKPQPK